MRITIALDYNEASPPPPAVLARVEQDARESAAQILTPELTVQTYAYTVTGRPWLGADEDAPILARALAVFDAV